MLGREIATYSSVFPFLNYYKRNREE
jgi:hypothetical protein